MAHQPDHVEAKGQWELEDLSSKSPGIKAVPCIFLEKWRSQRTRSMTSEELAREIQRRLGISYKGRGTARLMSFFTEREKKLGLEPLFYSEPIYDSRRGRVVKQWSWDPDKHENLFERFEAQYSPFRESPVPVKIALENLEIEIQKLLNLVASLEKEKSALQGQLAMPVRIGAISDQKLQKRCAHLLDTPGVQLDTVIREASVVLEDRLRSLAGLGSDYHGVRLVDAALKCDDPRIVFSEVSAEQEGVRYLFRGAVQYIRNPPAHRLIEYNRETAMIHIRLVDILLSLLRGGDQTQHPRS